MKTLAIDFQPTVGPRIWILVNADRPRSFSSIARWGSGSH